MRPLRRESFIEILTPHPTAVTSLCCVLIRISPVEVQSWDNNIFIKVKIVLLSLSKLVYYLYLNVAL